MAKPLPLLTAHRLKEAIVAARRWRGEGLNAVEIIARLQDHFGAITTDRGSTYTLRCCGVTGSCTHSKTDALLASWESCAGRRVAVPETESASA